MNTESVSFLAGIGVALAALSVIALYLLFALLVYLLAKLNLFVTQVDEGRAKAIKRNGRFAFAVMSYSGHTFRNDTPDPPTIQEDQSDVVPFNLTTMHGRRYLPLLTNIRWIGIPPFTSVHTYRFKWTSLEQDEKDAHGLETLYKTSEKHLDYILVQDDVYVSKIPTVECADNIPLDLVIVVGLRVTNVFKALFHVEQWLEATLNVINARMRDFVASRTYAQVRNISQADDKTKNDDALKIINDFIKSIKEQIEKDWGVRIKFVRIHSVDPGSVLAKEFIQASTQLYVAEQRALADEAAGRGLAARDKQHFEVISKIPGGPDMFKWQSIQNSNHLATYVEGGGNAIPVVPTGSQAPTSGNNQGGGNNTPATP